MATQAKCHNNVGKRLLAGGDAAAAARAFVAALEGQPGYLVDDGSVLPFCAVVCCTHRDSPYKRE